MTNSLTLTFPTRIPEEDRSVPILENCILALRTNGQDMPDAVFVGFTSFDTLAELIRDQASLQNASLIIVAGGRTLSAPDFQAMVERLTELIHEDLDDEGVEDDPELRSDAFDDHPWAPLREAFWAAEPKIRGEDSIRLEAVSDGALCTMDAAKGWRVTGPGGEEAVFEAEEDAARDVRDRLQGRNLSLRIVSLDHVFECADIDEACEELTEAISDGIPSIEEEDARDDDFDNHPLTPIRDALVDVSPNFGGNGPDI